MRGASAWRDPPTLSRDRPGRSLPMARVGAWSWRMSLPGTIFRPAPGRALATTWARAPSAIRIQVRGILVGMERSPLFDDLPLI